MTSDLQFLNRVVWWTCWITCNRTRQVVAAPAVGHRPAEASRRARHRRRRQRRPRDRRASRDLRHHPIHRRRSWRSPKVCVSCHILTFCSPPYSIPSPLPLRHVFWLVWRAIGGRHASDGVTALPYNRWISLTMMDGFDEINERRRWTTGRPSSRSITVYRIAKVWE